MGASHLASFAADAAVGAPADDAQSGACPGGLIAAIDGAATGSGNEVADVGVRPQR